MHNKRGRRRNNSEAVEFWNSLIGRSDGRIERRFVTVHTYLGSTTTFFMLAKSRAPGLHYTFGVEVGGSRVLHPVRCSSGHEDKIEQGRELSSVVGFSRGWEARGWSRAGGGKGGGAGLRRSGSGLASWQLGVFSLSTFNFKGWQLGLNFGVRCGVGTGLVTGQQAAGGNEG